MNPDDNPAPAKASKVEEGFVDTDIEEEPESGPDIIYEYVTLTLSISVFDKSSSFGRKTIKTAKSIKFSTKLTVRFALSKLLPAIYDIDDYEYIYDLRKIKNIDNMLSNYTINVHEGIIHASQLENVNVTATVIGNETDIKQCNTALTAPIANLFKKLYGVIPGNSYNMSFLYKDIMLDDSKSLAYYGIANDVVLKIIPNLVTGGIIRRKRPVGTPVPLNTNPLGVDLELNVNGTVDTPINEPAKPQHCGVYGECACTYLPGSRCIRTVPGFSTVKFIKLDKEELDAQPDKTIIDKLTFRKLVFKYGFRSILIIENIGVYMLTQEQANAYPISAFIIYLRQKKIKIGNASGADNGGQGQTKAEPAHKSFTVGSTRPLPSSPNYSYTPKGCDNGTSNQHPTVQAMLGLNITWNSHPLPEFCKRDVGLKLSVDGTVDTGLETQCPGSGEAPQNSRPLGVGLKLSVDGTDPKVHLAQVINALINRYNTDPQYTDGIGLQSHCSSTPVPRNSHPPPFSLTGEPASKREPVRLDLAEQNAGVGLELSVDGTSNLHPTVHSSRATQFSIMLEELRKAKANRKAVLSRSNKKLMDLSKQ